jgi:cytoskeleton protein RodZ
MPEIGSTLREARMRRRIDIQEVETATKIRAKYLRALENEEWSLLPGATFVKTFLRTYAEFLGLDGRLLVEEYKARYEPVSQQEMPQFTQRLDRRRRRPVPSRPKGPPVWLVIVAVLVAIIGGLALLGSLGSGTDKSADTGPRTTTTNQRSSSKAAGGSGSSTTTTQKKPASRTVSLRIVPTGAVWVCLEDARGRKLIPGQQLSTGSSKGPYRSSKFRITLGNGNAVLRVNGKSVRLQQSAEGQGFTITRAKQTPLSPAQRPTCA